MYHKNMIVLGNLYSCCLAKRGKTNISNYISLCLLLPEITRSNTGLWKDDFSKMWSRIKGMLNHWGIREQFTFVINMITHLLFIQLIVKKL